MCSVPRKRTKNLTRSASKNAQTRLPLQSQVALAASHHTCQLPLIAPDLTLCCTCASKQLSAVHCMLSPSTTPSSKRCLPRQDRTTKTWSLTPLLLLRAFTAERLKRRCGVPGQLVRRLCATRGKAQGVESPGLRYVT